VPTLIERPLHESNDAAPAPERVRDLRGGRLRLALPPLRDWARRVRKAIPEGHALPDEVWERRHRGIVVLLWVQAIALAVFAMIRGYTIVHSVGEALLVGGCAVVAGRRRGGRKLRAGIATFGLVTSSALLVHFSGGVIETHFHFFVMLGIISLYQDWIPFLLAIGFVVLHHGTMGVLQPDAVYNHPAAWANPWKWAGIHGTFVLMASVANLVTWRVNEAARQHAEMILNSAGEGIFGLDLDGTITFMNEAAARMIGTDLRDVVGRGAHDVLHDGGRADHALETCAFHAVPTDGPPAPAEDEYHRRGGGAFPVEYVARATTERAMRVGVVVTFRDVTERKRADAELGKTLSLLSATLESTADGILVVDSRGRITSLNRKFVEMWRIPDSVVASRSDDEALACVLGQLKDPDGFLAKVRELYADTELESFDVLEFKDGRVFERYSKAQQVGGASVGRVWSFRDVTDRYRLDAMKDGFLSAVSHEMRTPLSSVLGYALTLQQQGERLGEGDRTEIVGRLASQARRLQRLLADVLDIDRLSRGILEPRRNPTNIAELVKRVVGDTDVAFERFVEIDAEPIVAAVEAAKIERIVENLLINANRHTPSGTTVWVRARAEDGGVLIAVEDSGPGVPDDHKRAIFESFRQGPSVASHSPGVGIGLALVAGFAELHGGRAWVEDRPGGGASFRVFLPGATAPAAAG
jgi:PAS domain S-box-containing protein